MPEPDDTVTSSEPVLTGHLITLILGAAAAFGVDVASDTVGKIAAAVAGVLVVAFTAWVSRSKVTPMAKVDATVAAAVAAVQPAPAASARDDILYRPDPDDIPHPFDMWNVSPIAPPAPPAPPTSPPSWAARRPTVGPDRP